MLGSLMTVGGQIEPNLDLMFIVVVFVSMAVGVIATALIISILSIAFRTCTGWQPDGIATPRQTTHDRNGGFLRSDIGNGAGSDVSSNGNGNGNGNGGSNGNGGGG
jgi:hypothetical protein